ncbi:hypothetical protein ACFPOI_43485 [Nonomuraea angiospora]|uniref:Uncharacterized protein n=1 Tax=Nonomuraea angiospora TaxID=46172 RepID=A0ABR9LWW8_9ACTN|nr:hypothetical protein [Nonomuraea angiospora]MBE1584561.1 hypothetical protein [Nonomuraea angiospora]
MTVRDLTVAGGGRVMRIVAIGEVGNDTATLVSAADPDAEREYVVACWLAPMPTGADVVKCMACLWDTHLWTDATHINRWSGYRMRLIRCVRCYVDLLRVRDVVLHATSTTIRLHDLER